MEPYAKFVRNEWWDVAILSIDNEKEKARVYRSIQSIVKESWDWLNETLHLDERAISNVLNIEYVAR